MKFVKLPAPYLDFCIINGVTLDENQLDNLRSHQIAREHELDIDVIRSADNDTFVLITSNRRQVHSEGSGASGLSGIARNEDSLIIPLESNLNDADTALDTETGLYTRFVIGNNRASITTDMFGYGHSFYSQHRDMAIASNRLHLHRIVLDILGIPIRPDEAAVISTLFSNQPFFSQQSCLGRTLIAGVALVPVTHNLKLSRGRADLVLKPDYASSEMEQSLPLNKLVSLGVEKILDNTRVALESKRMRRVIVDLTGGKDSRLVFGSATNQRGWRNKVRINTLGQEESDDVRISAALTHLFGAEYYQGDTTQQIPLSIDDNLNFWRSYYYGSYHRLAAKSWINNGKNLNELSLGGANGEIYRSFWVNQVGKFSSNAATVADFANHLVKASAIPGVCGPSELDTIKSALTTELEAYASSTLEGKIEDHYLHHRNRTHCGLRGITFFHDRLTWYPLMSRQLYSASRAVSYEDLLNAKIIYMLTDALNPILADIPYEGDDPFRKMRRPSSLLSIADTDSTTDAWAVSNTSAKNFNQQRQQNESPRMNWPGLPRQIDLMVESAIEDLDSLDDITNLVSMDALRSSYYATVQNSRPLSYQYASRIISVRDAMVDS